MQEQGRDGAEAELKETVQPNSVALAFVEHRISLLLFSIQRQKQQPGAVTESTRKIVYMTCAYDFQ